MKIIIPFLFLLVTSCTSGKETLYIGSTPANSNVVRSFLGIPFSDSVDFIKWKLHRDNDQYVLQCQFGIGKQNTDGFINDGQKIELKGKLRKEKNYWSLENGNKGLKIIELNTNILHLLDNDNSLLVGTGGWSYSLSRNDPFVTDEVNFFSKQITLKDSMSFVGRTPCREFSINRASPNCIKMKWSLVFYTDVKTNKPTTYLLNRSNMMPLEYPGKIGTWKIIRGKDGRIIYELKPDDENTPTYLLKIDDNILAFTDEKGKLLAGNKDFSFTLSRRQ